MPRGGSKPGERRGGRQKGTKNKTTLARKKALADSGLSPLDYLLSLVRNEKLEDSTRMDAAKAAAPYVHPRLASTEVKTPDGEGIVFKMIVKPDGD